MFGSKYKFWCTNIHGKKKKKKKIFKKSVFKVLWFGEFPLEIAYLAFKKIVKNNITFKIISLL